MKVLELKTVIVSRLSLLCRGLTWYKGLQGTFLVGGDYLWPIMPGLHKHHLHKLPTSLPISLYLSVHIGTNLVFQYIQVPI